MLVSRRVRRAMIPRMPRRSEPDDASSCAAIVFRVRNQLLIFGSDILHGVKPLSETEFCQGAGSTAVVGTGAVSLAPKASPPVRTARDTDARGSRAPCWQNFSGRSRR